MLARPPWRSARDFPLPKFNSNPGLWICQLAAHRLLVWLLSIRSDAAWQSASAVQDLHRPNVSFGQPTVVSRQRLALLVFVQVLFVSSSLAAATRLPPWPRFVLLFLVVFERWHFPHH